MSNKILNKDQITINEAAEKYNYSARHLQDLCHKRKLKKTQLFARSWIISKSELEQYISLVQEGNYSKKNKEKLETNEI
jgi:excisionase family DNA binding protein